MIVDAFDVLHAECAKRPLVMGIALHPYIVGEPHRFKHLARALNNIVRRADDKVWFTTSGAIAAHAAALPQRDIVSSAVMEGGRWRHLQFTEHHVPRRGRQLPELRFLVAARVGQFRRQSGGRARSHRRCGELRQPDRLAHDIVAALAKAAPDALKGNDEAEDALKSLNEAMQKIDEIKQRRKTSAYDTARDALAKLGSADKGAYKRLVNSLDPDVPPGAA